MDCFSRMIGGYHLLYLFLDVLLVFIGAVHQVFQLLKEQVGVKRQRVADKNQVILRLLEAFFRHQLFFKQLLAFPKAGILNFDILVGDKAA